IIIETSVTVYLKGYTLNMPDFLKDPVSRLLYFHNSFSSRIIIALAGYPGSGKSTISKDWALEVNKKTGSESLITLGMDGFHLSKKRLQAMEDPESAFARRGAPYTFNPGGLISKMKELKSAAGKHSVGWPGFEHGIGDPVENALTVPAECRLILIEGIYTLYREGEWSELEDSFNETWFLDVSIETSMNRLYKRHMEAWNMNEQEAREKAAGNDLLNCQNITSGRSRANYLIRG
ncbi:MAG: hypothetical protein KAH21_08600, partial [Spirochaetaceae bacterium]|nr:hypothetical protein [Spirochaetaceae bacterium]